jgi:membrane-associated phospholipid phosphatase
MPSLRVSWVMMVLVLLRLGLGTGAALPLSLSVVGDEVTTDVKSFMNNLEADAEDLLTAPLHVRALFAEDGLVYRPAFAYTLLGTGALLGGAFALDQTLRSHLRHMSPHDADLLQDISYGTVGVGTGLLYTYGLSRGDPQAREYALTAAEGAGVAALTARGLKAAFGRLRPSQTARSTAFFRGGASFVSGDVTPLFGLATGISAYFDHTWSVAGPVYALALLDGFGRMGHNAHWFSDVVGAGLLGVGTTELLLWLHRQHQQHPSRFRLFPVTAPGDRHGQPPAQPVGLGLAFNF